MEISMMDLAAKFSPAWQLAERGRYQQALDLYDEARSRGVELTPQEVGNCGTFLLCLNRYEEALAQFRAATELEDKSDKKGEGSYLAGLGVAQWLMGRHREAVTAWRYRVSGVLRGEVRHADEAGGASDGLLLWYAAVTLKDHDLLNYTTEYFQKLSIFGDLSLWPGPLVELALGEISAEAVFEPRFNNMWLRWLLAMDYPPREDFTIALFYYAVKLRVDGQEPGCREMMARVAKMKNRWGEVQWHLARGELSRA
jgi:tetratricopeptide (TPR) repeat protein